MMLLKQRFALARVNVTDPAIVTVRRMVGSAEGENTERLLAEVPSQWFASFALLAFI